MQNCTYHGGSNIVEDLGMDGLNELHLLQDQLSKKIDGFD